MTTATQEQGLVLTEDQQAILNQKKGTWSDMGASVYLAELSLQGKAQQLLATIKHPTKVSEIAASQNLLKMLKAEFTALQASRKSITSKFDAVTERLMMPEKSGVDPLKALEQAIIKIKEVEEAEKRVEAEKNKAFADCKQFIQTTRNNAEAQFKTLILEKVNKCYNHALGQGNITPDELDMFIELCIEGLKDTHFKIQYPLNAFSKHVSTDEFTKMCAETLIIDAQPWLAEYQNSLRAKFADYNIAYNNKEDALKRSHEEAATQAKNIESEKANANAAATLQAVGTVHEAVLTTGTKALKKSFEVDMEESLENSVVVMNAFVANIHLAASKLKVNKWDSFTIGQMKNALGKCKSDDNVFAPQGITFKEVSKL